jgi:hypothetical protein
LFHNPYCFTPYRLYMRPVEGEEGDLDTRKSICLCRKTNRISPSSIPRPVHYAGVETFWHVTPYNLVSGYQCFRLTLLPRTKDCENVHHAQSSTRMRFIVPNDSSLYHQNNFKPHIVSEFVTRQVVKIGIRVYRYIGR